QEPRPNSNGLVSLLIATLAAPDRRALRAGMRRASAQQSDETAFAVCVPRSRTLAPDEQIARGARVRLRAGLIQRSSALLDSGGDFEALVGAAKDWEVARRR